MPVKAKPIAIAAADWAGFYLGLGLGTRSIESDGSVVSATNNGANIIGCVGGCVGGIPFNGTAFRVSPYVGYNWQFAPQWLVGIEADYGWANRTIRRNGMLYPGGGFPIYLTGRGDDSFAIKTTWDASIRGRFGLVATPNTLAYVTAGAAWLHYESTSVCGVVSFCIPGGFQPAVITNAHTRLGWTIGGGVEAMLWTHWIARAEYRYADFGTVTNADTRGIPGLTQVATYTTHVTSHTATLGLAYKFGGANNAYAAYAAAAVPVPAPVTSWTGAYLGLGLGTLSSVADGSVLSATNNGVPLIPATCAGGCVASESLNGTAFRASVYGGYNWQFSPQWLVGIEADYGWGQKETRLQGAIYPGGGFPFYLTGRGDDAFSVKTDWDAGLRARFGMLVQPDLLLYVTGGAAWQHFTTTSTCGPAASCAPGFFGPAVITNSHARLGWTVGGGFESKLWGNWIARGEYRYADYGTVTDTDTRINPVGAVTQVATYSTSLKTHTATVGLGYLFASR